MNEQPRRYALAIDDRAIDDLRQLLARRRWPDQVPWLLRDELRGKN